MGGFFFVIHIHTVGFMGVIFSYLNAMRPLGFYYSIQSSFNEYN